MKKELLTKLIGQPLLCLIMVVYPFLLTGCSDDKEDGAGERLITISEDQLAVSLEAEDTYASISFTALTSWTASVKEADATAWLSLSVDKGIGGMMKVGLVLKKNTNKELRTATVVLTSGNTKQEVSITQAGTSLEIMEGTDVKDFDKYYKPAEFSNMNMLRSDAKWSWFRSKQSEHFFVFWEAGFGDDPNAATVDAALRVDIDDLLEKAEQFYKTNIEILKFAELGQGKSYLDKYKMEIYLLYQTEWLATGSGYDDTIGALWVNPSTCQPVGSTIAHEIGHSFQYQVYCDKILQGEPNDFKHGFRYGYEGSNGGNGFWEQCAQWQSYQDYPEQLFANYHFDVWLANCHRHFEHEWMRYASYWLQYYWTQKHGIETVGEIWKRSASPEDAIGTYMRLYCGNQWEAMKTELYDYAARMATFDIDVIRDYADGYIGKYSTKLYQVEDNYYQIAYASCPGTTGFNVIALNVPKAGTTITANFEGLAPGSALAADDPGEYMESEAVKGNVGKYNAGTASNVGWRYGFVALKTDGTRVYGEMNQKATNVVNFNIPANTDKLYFVVLGAPNQYKANPWDEKELTDEQWPYKVKFNGTDLLGSFDIDTNADPKNIEFIYNFNCSAATEGYDLGSIDLQANGDIQKLAQAFVMQPSVLSGNMLTIANEQTSNPAEGKIALGLLQVDGTYSYTYTANGGFYCTAEGNQGSWANNAPIWVEYDKDAFVFKYGHKPGSSVAGKKYTIKPTLVYTKNGKEYRATFVLNMQF